MSIGKAVPYGIYDVAHNRGFVNVGTSHDTPDFAVESIRLWWEQEGQTRYPAADSLLVLADSGVATAPGVAFGKSAFKRWRTRCRSPSLYVIYRLAPASGTRSNTDCSPTSASI